MAKRILIFSSDHTGHGHKSITESLLEAASQHPDLTVRVVDGFQIGGTVSLRVGKMYGSLTRNAKELWKILWQVSTIRPQPFNELTAMAIEDAVIDEIRTFRPDLILSVHPNFNGSVIDILEEHQIKIPFVTLIADIVCISSFWMDDRADMILCPTAESQEKCLAYGVPQDKTRVTGFPIRKRFYRSADVPHKPVTDDRVLNFLIMSGGEGSGNMSRIAKTLLMNFNCKVQIITGRNAALKRRIENSLSAKFGDRVVVHGFVTNVQELMMASDIAITRGSPNTMLEAVACQTPLIVTGALPGQEELNPWYIEHHGLGINCEDLPSLKYVVKSLIAQNGRKLDDIREKQKAYASSQIAPDIVSWLAGYDTSHVDPEQMIRKKSLLKEKFAAQAAKIGSVKQKISPKN